MSTNWPLKDFGQEIPILMAPMFLVSNEHMLIAASRAGISGCIPSLNARTQSDLLKLLKTLDEQAEWYGVNLIVNQSNPKLSDHLEAVLNSKARYIITSLGNPKKVIEAAHSHGKKVFCDVTDVTYAKKVEELGADALIAVNNSAGGHAGDHSANILIPLLRQNCSLPVISAGGVGDAQGVQAMLTLGAAGVSVGTPFIATHESSVAKEYKEACIKASPSDIVMTTKLSGTPCTVIETPYVKKIGTKQNIFEKILNKNRKLKKWAKGLTFYRGMKALEKAAFSATYKTLWCAGPSVSFVNKVQSVEDVVIRLRGPENNN